MKNIKRINEDWSNDYTYDFTDAGFEVEENGLILTGKYKGKFLMTQVNDWFAEMTAKMSDCLLYTSPSPRDRQKSRMPSSA